MLHYNNLFYIIYFYIIALSFFTVFFTCNCVFEQGHLEPWRYITDFYYYNYY